MNINLHIEKDNFVKLCLLAGKKEIDCCQWQDRNNLSQLLLANLDKLLRKNHISLDKIYGYKIISEVPRKWTTYRIADITFKTLNIGKPSSSAGRLAKKNKVC